MISKFRIPLYILLLFLAAGCGVQSVTEPHRFDPDLEPTPVPTTAAIAKPTYTVARGEVVRSLALNGRIVPAEEIPLAFELDGEVAEVYVSGGDRVQAGELLAELDTSAYETELILAESRLEVAEAQLEAAEQRLANNRRRAEIALERVQLRLDFARQNAGTLPSTGQALEISLLELEVELAELALTELAAGVDPSLAANVTQSQLQVDELKGLIEDAQLVAPINGTVIRLNIEPEDLVSSADTAMIIADLSQYEIQAFVLEDDMQEMVEGMPAEVSVADRPGETLPATVVLLPFPYGSGELLEDALIRVAFDNPEDALPFSTGDRVVINMVLAERSDTLWLPAAAVREFQGRFFVVVQDGDAQRRADVSLGVESKERLEILEGVQEGDTVIGP